MDSERYAKQVERQQAATLHYLQNRHASENT